MMKRPSSFTLSLLLLTAIPISLSAKGKTVKITIHGPNLKIPIEITDPKVLANFNVWSGAGTSSNESESLIIDWSQGTIPQPPKGLPIYEVCFYADFQKDKPVYVVTYEYDPATQRGYVYLPGKADKWGPSNMGTILRSVEGNWFGAWSLWDDVARPLLAQAKRSHLFELAAKLSRETSFP